MFSILLVGASDHVICIRKYYEFKLANTKTKYDHPILTSPSFMVKLHIIMFNTKKRESSKTGSSTNISVGGNFAKCTIKYLKRLDL